MEQTKQEEQWQANLAEALKDDKHHKKQFGFNSKYDGGRVVIRKQMT